MTNNNTPTETKMLARDFRNREMDGFDVLRMQGVAQSFELFAETTEAGTEYRFMIFPDGGSAVGLKRWAEQLHTVFVWKSPKPVKYDAAHYEQEYNTQVAAVEFVVAACHAALKEEWLS